jgi:hypothetical protein
MCPPTRDSSSESRGDPPQGSESVPPLTQANLDLMLKEMQRTVLTAIIGAMRTKDPSLPAHAEGLVPNSVRNNNNRKQFQQKKRKTQHRNRTPHAHTATPPFPNTFGEQPKRGWSRPDGVPSCSVGACLAVHSTSTSKKSWTNFDQRSEQQLPPQPRTVKTRWPFTKPSLRTTAQPTGFSTLLLPGHTSHPLTPGRY